MMNKFGKFTAVVLLLTVSVFPLQAEVREADVQAVYEMFEAQGMQEQMNQIILTMVQNQVKAFPQMKAYQFDMLQFFMRTAGYDAVKKDLAGIYLKHFTVGEIREITKFYRSPIGKKMRAVSAPILLEANELSRRRIEKAVPEFMEMLRKKGVMGK